MWLCQNGAFTCVLMCQWSLLLVTAVFFDTKLPPWLVFLPPVGGVFYDF